MSIVRQASNVMQRHDDARGRTIVRSGNNARSCDDWTCDYAKSQSRSRHNLVVKLPAAAKEATSHVDRRRIWSKWAVEYGMLTLTGRGRSAASRIDHEW